MLMIPLISKFTHSAEPNKELTFNAVEWKDDAWQPAHEKDDHKLLAFARSGWRYLGEVAHDSGTTATDILIEASGVADLINKSCREALGTIKEYQPHNQALFTQAFIRLGKFDITRRPKAKDWSALEITAIRIRLLAKSVVMAQRHFTRRPTFDPFGTMDAEWMQQFLDALQILTLEDAQDMVDILVGARRALDAAAVARSDTIDPGPTASTQFSTSPELGEKETSLNVLLKAERVAFDPEVSYWARVAQGETYVVTLSDKLVAELSGPHERQGMRLLRSLVAQQSAKSGVKKLFTLGPKIIELKAVMRGHWRILGCLDGLHLRLLSLVDLPASGAAYAKRVPADLCRALDR